MILYHYTIALPSHLGSILAEGRLRVTESNVSFTIPHAGPDVVWFTDDPNPRAARRSGLGDIKVTARVSIDTDRVDGVERWSDFARRVGSSRDARRHLDRTGGRNGHRWYVVPREVTRNEWSAVESINAAGRFESIPVSASVVPAHLYTSPSLWIGSGKGFSGGARWRTLGY